MSLINFLLLTQDTLSSNQAPEDLLIATVLRSKLYGFLGTTGQSYNVISLQLGNEFLKH